MTLLRVALALALLQFTAPNGQVIWLNPDSIIAITLPDGCDRTARAAIITNGGPRICVAEDVGDSYRKVTGIRQ